jgi:drug/metabolite transporter (DMT)-like permease
MWGLNWWPLTQFKSLGHAGAQISFIAYGAVAGPVLASLLWRWRTWRPHAAPLIRIGLLGGWANAGLMSALADGEVMRVLLLFYLLPAWSVIGGKLFLHEPVSRWRAAALLLALTGVAVCFAPASAAANAFSGWSMPDALELSAGMAFAGNNLAAREATAVPLGQKTLVVFIFTAAFAGLLMASDGAPWRTPHAPVLLGLVLFGAGWMLLTTATTQYGVTHLPAGTSGILMLNELVVAMGSALAWGAGVLSAREAVGAALIVGAGVVEALGAARRPGAGEIMAGANHKKASP